MTIDDFERELTRGLHGLVDDVHPPSELRARIAEGIEHPTARRRRWMPAAAAALVLAALVGTVLAVNDDGPATVDLASDPGPSDASGVTLDETTTTAPSTTIATPPTTVSAGTDAVPSTTTPVTEAPAVAPQTTLPPATTVPCRDSTDPSCGPFRWDPAPVDRPATVSVAAPSGPIVAGRQVELTVSISDPDGFADLGCYSVALDRPGLSTGSCAVDNPETSCPARFGPWTPPPAKAHEASTTTIVEFHETGTYTVSVDVSPADGCDNVDPYRSGGTATITVEVVAPDATAG